MGNMGNMRDMGNIGKSGVAGVLDTSTASTTSAATRTDASRRPTRAVLVTSPQAERAAHSHHDHHGHHTPTPAEALRRAGIEVVSAYGVGQLQDAAVVAAVRAMRAGRRGDEVALVAAGGDGTISTVASLALAAGLPVGILPMGTSNDTARSLGIPLDLHHAAETIATGRPTSIDVGIIATDAEQAGATGWRASLLRRLGRARPPAPAPTFVHAATLGLNVEFARLATDANRRQRLGQLTYIASTVEALRRMQPVPVMLHLLDARTEGESDIAASTSGANDAAPDAAPRVSLACDALQVSIINTPVFGGWLNLRVPGVVANDRLLDFLIIEPPEPRHIAEWAEALLAAFAHAGGDMAFSSEHLAADELGPVVAALQHRSRIVIPGVRRFQASGARIETPAPVDVTLDGEIRATTPLELRLARQQLAVLLPQGPHAALTGDEGTGVSVIQ